MGSGGTLGHRTSGCLGHIAELRQPAGAAHIAEAAVQLVGIRSVVVEALPFAVASCGVDRTGPECLAPDPHLRRYGLPLGVVVLRLACAGSLLPSSWLST